MKLGVSFFTFKMTVNIFEAMTECNKAGYDGVELVVSREGELSPNTSKNRLKEFRQKAADLGLEIISIGADNVWEHNLASESKPERSSAIENVKRQIDIAYTCGADLALVVPGWVGSPFANGQVQYDRAYINSQESLEILTKFASSAKITIGIENVWNKFLLSPVEMARFLDEINSDYLGAYFDIGNIIYIGYPDQWIRILGKRIKRLQFCDCREEQSGLGKFVDIFEGDVDFSAVMQAVDDIGYNGWAVLEVFPTYRSFQYQSIYNGKRSLETVLNIGHKRF